MIYWRSVMLVFLGACSYGVLSTFVKFAYHEGFSVSDVSGSQMFFGFVLLWVVSLIKKGRPRASFVQWIRLACVGVSMGLTGAFYYFSLIYVPASLAIVLLFQFTWIGVVIEGMTKRKWPSWDKVISVFLLLIGTFLSADLTDIGAKSFSWLGYLTGGLSAISYALFIYFSGKVETGIDSLNRSAIMLTGALIITFLVFPPHFLFNNALGDGLLKWGLLLSLFGAVIPTLFFAMGVPAIGSGTATILGAAELPMAVLMSGFVLLEPVKPFQWIGVMIILLGMIYPEWKRWHQLRKFGVKKES